MTKKKQDSLQTSTPAWQRYSIWGILILTVVSTVALYASSFLQTQSHYDEQKKQSQILKKYQEYQKKLKLRQKNFRRNIMIVLKNMKKRQLHLMLQV